MLITSIESVPFQKFVELSKSNEGLVILGAGGDLMEWVTGITESLKTEHILDTESDFGSAYTVTTSGGRTDLLLILPESGIKMEYLAVWRIKIGDCSWLSDYVVNYSWQHQSSEDDYDGVDISERWKGINIFK